MVNRLYGAVRKKSNQAALEAAASKPAIRSPVEAAATMIRTSISAALVLSMASRTRASKAQASSGAKNETSNTAKRWRWKKRFAGMTPFKPLIRMRRRSGGHTDETLTRF
jgi:hypothetical protein